MEYGCTQISKKEPLKKACEGRTTHTRLQNGKFAIHGIGGWGGVAGKGRRGILGRPERKQTFRGEHEETRVWGGNSV